MQMLLEPDDLSARQTEKAARLRDGTEKGRLKAEYIDALDVRRLAKRELHILQVVHDPAGILRADIEAAQKAVDSANEAIRTQEAALEALGVTIRRKTTVD